MTDNVWSSVGYLVAKRTYARRLNEEDSNSPTEEWSDVVERVIAASDTQLGVGFSDEEKEKLRDHMMNLRGLVAGRFLWQLGTKTVDTLGLSSLQNCAACVVDEPIRPFTWTMDNLMLGAGVGYNIQKEYVYKLPKVSTNFAKPVRKDTAAADFIVPDTREGWVKLLEYTLRCAFPTTPYDRNGFTYSAQLIRGAGAPIRGFGGTASGPEILCKGIDQIGDVLLARAGKQLRPVDCLDIMNIIASIVVAGNVRRSAQIAIGDPDDLLYLRSKRWDLGPIPNWRSNSNNSVVVSDIKELPEEFWKGYEGKGEPFGLINLDLSRKIGRTGETKYKDKDVVAYNPCAEQSLADKETCCLAEVVLPNIRSEEELREVVTLLYRINKHSLALGSHNKDTEEIVNKNMRMGIGITGYLQSTEEQKSWLSSAYEYLREYDKAYSAEKGWPESIKLSTIKPSGTLSLLPGVTPGCHPAFARYVIRRVNISADSPLIKVIRDNGYPLEFRRHFDGTEDRTTMVAEFPMAYPEWATLAKDMTAIDQLEVVRRLQAEWSDNSVSCTVYYKKEELPEIRKYLEKNFSKNFKTLSFLLHNDHGFDQAPLEEITKEEYEERIKKTTPITSFSGFIELDDSTECEGGACPIR